MMYTYIHFESKMYILYTLQDIFITYEMWRFSENFAIFSDRQNFGRRNRIRRIIF